MITAHIHVSKRRP